MRSISAASREGVEKTSCVRYNYKSSARLAPENRFRRRRADVNLTVCEHLMREDAHK
ncbi:hypothetical protein VPHK389_0101 [Vibrio phage K389]